MKPYRTLGLVNQMKRYKTLFMNGIQFTRASDDWSPINVQESKLTNRE